MVWRSPVRTERSAQRVVEVPTKFDQKDLLKTMISQPELLCSETMSNKSWPNQWRLNNFARKFFGMGARTHFSGLVPRENCPPSSLNVMLAIKCVGVSVPS
jgi:hypothetical protein